MSMYLLLCLNVQQMFPFGITAYTLRSDHLIQTILQDTERFSPGTLLMVVTSQSKTVIIFWISKYLVADTCRKGIKIGAERCYIPWTLER